MLEEFPYDRARELTQHYAAAAYLATRHFNDYDHSVIPEIEYFENVCSFVFTDPIYADSSQGVAALVAAQENDICAVMAPPNGDITADILPSVDALELRLLSYFRDDRKAELVRHPGVILSLIHI